MVHFGRQQKGELYKEVEIFDFWSLILFSLGDHIAFWPFQTIELKLLIGVENRLQLHKSCQESNIDEASSHKS